MAGEFDFIHWIRARQRPHLRVSLGIGDDLAALRWPGDDLLLVGVDQVLDTVHFNSALHSPADIGKKAMNRNLSDCAAMACLPTAAVVTVALPKGSGDKYARSLYLGMKEAGESFDCPIVGGDTASWQGKLVVTVTILGRSAGIIPITRSGAKPGDIIYVTGPLGGSIAGRHMTFEPRVALARELATGWSITSMIDLSDGLSRDIQHICHQSGVGAEIDSWQLPLHADISKIRQPGWARVDHAVHDGEDYELLFTSPACNHPVVHAIGHIMADKGVFWLGPNGREILKPKAWEHSL